MTVRWTVRAATDRGLQAESRVLFEAESTIIRTDSEKRKGSDYCFISDIQFLYTSKILVFQFGCFSTL